MIECHVAIAQRPFTMMETPTGQIIRKEFIGSRILFVLLCFTILGIPAAILYLLQTMVTVIEEVEDPNEFMEQFRNGKYRTK